MLRKFEDAAAHNGQMIADDFGIADIEVRGPVLVGQQQQQQQNGYPSCPQRMALVMAQQQAQI